MFFHAVTLPLILKSNNTPVGVLAIHAETAILEA